MGRQETPLQVRMRAASHRVTWMLGTRFPEAIPLTFVVGYPKSGTVWASQLVADYLQLPYPRFSLLPVGFEAVVHGHQVVRDDYRRCVYTLRDGRDVMCSHYFFLARRIPGGDRAAVPRSLRAHFPGLTNKADVRGNLPRFIEAQARLHHSSPVNWAEHVRSWLARKDRSGVVMLRYEDLLADAAGALIAAMPALTGEPADEEQARATADRFSFARQARRRAGREGASFLRKGSSGDWTNHFTREAAEVFDRALGETLVECGYERDRSWVSRVGGAGEGR
ncbi:MAG TPA: sulfotransferase domain-containing protein [Phycisphaerales bacterium]|nr:sulfotransferase domain-containing protein [Phycisphaerales bacterium]